MSDSDLALTGGQSSAWSAAESALAWSAAESALGSIRSAPWYRGQAVHVVRQPARAACHRDPAVPLPRGVAAFLERSGLTLYSHQAELLDRWHAGEDVVLATQTASGKSLAYNLAVGEVLSNDAGATALYLFPTKALARDQLAGLVELDQALGLAADPAAYDGDTPAARRAGLRSRSRILVTNPWALHEYLASTVAWQHFLGRLRVVVVDEAHRYRGVYGAHVAFLLRRLQRICARLGTEPRFLLASATIANPAEHATALLGRPVAAVEEDGSAFPGRIVVCWDSLADPSRSAASQAARLVATLAAAGHQTLCFTGSRAGAELVADWAAAMAPTTTVSPYRAGYHPRERREIEERLRNGQLDAVVSTNALELGIDIGGLEAVVLTGYPGTVAATWQQIGRAGRAGRAALAVLVAGDDPLDQYVVRHPELVFGAKVERAVLPLSNPGVLVGELACAAAELPLRPGDGAAFGPGFAAAVRDLEAEGILAAGPAGHIFAGSFRPASAVRLDGSAAASVEVRSPEGTVEVLERDRALREAYPGAVLVHRGLRYRVSRLDLDAGLAESTATDAAEHTAAVTSRRYELGDVEETRVAGDWTVSLGAVRIHQQVVGYKLRRGDEVLATERLELPPTVLTTRGIWPRPLADATGSDPATPLGAIQATPLGALHAAEHALVHVLPLLAMADRGDAGGLSTTTDGATGQPLVVLYDGYEGGSGIAEMAFEHFAELATLALDLAASCTCEQGCPRCVYDRACGSDNQPMDRLGAVAVLGSLSPPGRSPASPGSSPAG